jgi:hypothetical protein
MIFVSEYMVSRPIVIISGYSCFIEKMMAKTRLNFENFILRMFDFIQFHLIDIQGILDS